MSSNISVLLSHFNNTVMLFVFIGLSFGISDAPRLLQVAKPIERLDQGIDFRP
jgi:hypothetical protein